MNELETPPVPPDDAVSALRDEVQSLRAVTILALLMLIFLSGSLNILLRLQASVLSTQAAETQRVVSEFDAKFKPAATDFWNKLVEYSRAHPDFTPTLEKYRPYMVVAFPPGPATTPPASK